MILFSTGIQTIIRRFPRLSSASLNNLGTSPIHQGVSTLLPTLIRESLPKLTLRLATHPQLSVRDNATHALAYYLSRCPSHVSLILALVKVMSVFIFAPSVSDF